MPLPTIANTVRVSARGTNVGGSSWVNVVHARYTGSGDPYSQANIDALHALLVRIWSGTAYGTGAAWLTNCKQGTLLIDMTYYPLNGTGLGILKDVGANATGGTTAQCPQEVAAVATHLTGYRGRKYRGRTFFPAPLQTKLDTNGNWTQALVDQTITQLRGVRDAVKTVSWEMVVASYGQSWINDKTDPHDKVLSTWTPFATPVTDFKMDLLPDVQRRRK